MKNIISREEFTKIMQLIQNFMSEQDTLSALIEKLTDGYCVVSFGDYLIDKIIDLLNLNMGIKDKDLIYWWLYEDVNKIIYFSDRHVYVETLDQLYDYIIKYEISN